MGIRRSRNLSGSPKALASRSMRMGTLLILGVTWVSRRAVMDQSLLVEKMVLISQRLERLPSKATRESRLPEIFDTVGPCCWIDDETEKMG